MPYAPGIQSDWSALYQGVANLGQNIQKFADQQKRNSQETTSIRRLLEIYSPDQKDRWNAMGLKDLRAEAGAFAAKQYMQRQSEQSALTKAQMANLAADNTRSDAFLKLQHQQFADSQGRLARQQADQDRLKAAVARFRQDVGRGPTDATFQDVERFAGPGGDIKFALSRNPEAISDPGVQHLINYFTRMKEMGQDLTSDFIEDPSTGARFLKYGRQVMPSGTNPDRLQPNAEPLMGPDGNPVPGVHLVRNPRGNGWQVVKTPEPQVKTDPLPGRPGFKGTPAQLSEWEKSMASKETSPADSGGTIIDGLLRGLGLGAQPTQPTAAEPQAKPAETNTVRRKTDDGRTAIFDSTTKKFLRYE